ncbi:hypothetical protein COI_0224 [Mannheimia haemolytica serotype A2 str. OVINE]|nr:hypothetical protein COI_0224 [Mannheimia haemolytica serotype A2 str. OVINE]
MNIDLWQPVGGLQNNRLLIFRGGAIGLNNQGFRHSVI